MGGHISSVTQAVPTNVQVFKSEARRDGNYLVLRHTTKLSCCNFKSHAKFAFRGTQNVLVLGSMKLSMPNFTGSNTAHIQEVSGRSILTKCMTF